MQGNSLVAIAKRTDKAEVPDRTGCRMQPREGGAAMATLRTRRTPKASVIRTELSGSSRCRWRRRSESGDRLRGGAN